MAEREIGTREEWQAARDELAKLEAEQAQRNEEVKQKRRDLPWVPVEKEYEFISEDGRKTLADLFDGRSQLIVYHFMFGPDWEAGCPSCSFAADEFDGGIVHLNQRDVTMLCVSRAPLAKLDAYKRRMGWRFRWASSLESDFNFDFGVSFTEEQQANGGEHNFHRVDKPGDELPGLSAFALVDGTVYRTYSTYGRGLDIIDNVYQLLDRAPKGRDDAAHPEWPKRRDEY
jgi:predicted dithiol-disulfide oxidoreductase (DUF899 family)